MPFKTSATSGSNKLSNDGSHNDKAVIDFSVVRSSHKDLLFVLFKIGLSSSSLFIIIQTRQGVRAAATICRGQSKTQTKGDICSKATSILQVSLDIVSRASSLFLMLLARSMRVSHG